MYFSDALRVIARRWWIALIGLALVAGGAVAVLKVVSTQYQASGQVLLLPPSLTANSDGGNPYLSLPSGITFTASLVAGTVTTRDTQRDLAADGFTSAYTVSVVPGTGPLIVVTVKDTDPTAALRMRDRLVATIEQRVEDVQTAEGVAERHLIVSRKFSVDTQAEVLAGAKMRALVLVGAVGMVVTLMAMFSVDRTVVRRRAAKAAQPAAQAHGTQPTAPSSTIPTGGHPVRVMPPPTGAVVQQPDVPEVRPTQLGASR